MSEPVVETKKVAMEEPLCLKRSCENDVESSTVETQPKKPRLKKKKYVMLMSYCGQGYYGMQINHGFKTIEGDLFQAFEKLGIMDEESVKSPQLINFQRAARTDKGVSATRQVVSLKMYLPEEEDVVQQICSHLPDCIRIFAIKKATSGFNSKTACDGRTYGYVLPTFAFTAIGEMTNREFRITAELMKEVNQVLGYFKGTKNFHNFTSRRLPSDPSCKRYITEFICGEPFLIREMEFVKITVKGQSFMLHQIRKMVGLAIAILRGFASKETLEIAFNLERIDVPMAPSLNLLLEEPHYGSYNRKFGSDGLHELLSWEAYEKEIEQFSLDQIMPVIYNGEIEEDSMLNWLANLPLHSYALREDEPSTRSATRTEFGRAAVAIELSNRAIQSAPSDSLNGAKDEQKDQIANGDLKSQPSDSSNETKDNCNRLE